MEQTGDSVRSCFFQNFHVSAGVESETSTLTTSTARSRAPAEALLPPVFCPPKLTATAESG